MLLLCGWGCRGWGWVCVVAAGGCGTIGQLTLAKWLGTVEGGMLVAPCCPAGATHL